MARNSEPLYLKLSDALAEQIMDFVKIVPTGNIAAMMQLLAGESVYRIMRLRLANDESMLREANYLPCNRFPEFSRQMVKHQSLYRVLQNRFALNIDVAEETFEPSLLRPMGARMRPGYAHRANLLRGWKSGRDLQEFLPRIPIQAPCDASSVN